LKKFILHRLLTPGIDKIEAVKQKSFIVFLLFQFIFTAYSISMIFYYPDSRSVYVPAAIYTLTIPILGLIFIRNHFNRVVKIYTIVNWFTALGFLFYINGNNASHALLALVFLNVCVYASVLIKYYWGFILCVLTIFFFIVDYYFEQAFPHFGATTVPASTFHYLIAVFCYFFVIVGFIVIYALLLGRSISHYKEELQLRLSTQKELQQVNSALHDMNDELKESMAMFGEVNDKLASYAFKNAHEVRAPLCRLLGLINLLDKINDEEEKRYIIDQITVSTEELNSVITEMNVLLQEEVYLQRHFQ